MTRPPTSASTGTGVLGTGSFLPDRVVTNAEAGAAALVDHDWISRKTGIHERRWAAPTQATSDLAATAAERALDAAGIGPDELSVIVVATSTPDQPQPPTATAVQHRLGAVNAAAFDVNAVCSGFVFALAVAYRMIAGNGGHALVVGADVYSRILDPADRRTVVLFGDGAGAVVLGPVPAGRGLLATSLHSFGERRELIEVPAGGSRRPASTDSVAEGAHFFRMNGREVREFVQDNVPPLVDRFLADTGTAPHDIAHLVPHQANGVMLDELTTALRLPGARVHRSLHRYGNTGAASVPITLDLAARSGIDRDQLVLLAAFGGGMAAGLALLRW